MAMLMASYLKGYFLNDSKIKNTLILLGVTIFIGVVWEFAEYIANSILSPIIYKQFEVRTYFMGNLDDTINDLFMDIMGALSFSLHFLGRRKTH